MIEGRETDVNDDPATRILAAIESLRVDVMTRIDRLQDRLTTQHETEVVNLGIAERAERIAKTTEDNVRTMGEQINALLRMVHALSGRVDHLEDKSG
jgi:hypothetical protein